MAERHKWAKVLSRANNTALAQVHYPAILHGMIPTQPIILRLYQTIACIRSVYTCK